MIVIAPLACYFLLFQVLVAAASSLWQDNITYFIRPNTSISCPLTECLTLEEFAERHLVGNTTTGITLELLSGNHNLSTNVTLHNLEGITIRPLTSDSRVLVRCTKPSTLIFSDITFLMLSQFSIDSCGTNHGTIAVVNAHQANFSKVTIVNGYGSAISIYNSSLTLDSAIIACCGFFESWYFISDAHTFGGAIFGNGSDLIISGDTVFSENLAHYGGGICFHLGSLTITGNTKFAHNCADQGGGIYIYSSKMFIMSNNVLFFNNTARYGGAMTAADVFMLEYSGTFLNNSAQYGGALVLKNTTAIAKETVITGNHANISGGGIVLQSSKHMQSGVFIIEDIRQQ